MTRPEPPCLTNTVETMKHKPTHRGFTLIEMLVTVVIISVLTLIAVPMYKEYSVRARRADGKAALLRAVHWFERAATATGSYPVMDNRQLDALGLGSSEADHYDVFITNSTATSYYVTASPRKGDDQCGNLTLTHAGVQGRTGSDLSVDACWSR